MSHEHPTAIELQFQAQSLQRAGARLEREILVNGALRAEVERLARECGALKERLEATQWKLVCALCLLVLCALCILLMWEPT